MPFSRLEAGAVARSLSQIADRPEDRAEVYLERRERLEVPAEGEAPGVRLRRESGFSIRLVREGLTWMAARDGFDPAEFEAALRQVARARPRAAYPPPELAVEPWTEPVAGDEVAAFPVAVRRAVRERRVAFPLRLAVSRHRRELMVIGTRLIQEPQRESFYSVVAETPWGRHGALLTAVGERAAEELARALIAGFRARDAPSPSAGPVSLVLEPAAAAVLLHETVAHAFEVDTLLMGGRPESVVGMQLGFRGLSVLDDPAAAPDSVARTSDDEGVPVVRRWLLREGVVMQPIADLFGARRSSRLVPGAARRSGRHYPPVPRSSHLELVAGDADRAELLAGAEGGLLVSEVRYGRLEPVSGEFVLGVPYAHRIAGGEAGEPVGPFELRGRVAELLGAVAAVGSRRRVAGAGWCAKGGQRLPVWSTAPAVLIERAEVWA